MTETFEIYGMKYSLGEAKDILTRLGYTIEEVRIEHWSDRLKEYHYMWTDYYAYIGNKPKDFKREHSIEEVLNREFPNLDPIKLREVFS